MPDVLSESGLFETVSADDAIKRLNSVLTLFAICTILRKGWLIL